MFKKISSVKILLLCVIMAMLPVGSYAMTRVDPSVQGWTKDSSARASDGEQTLSISITYYSNEYVEALVQAQAQKNLWTNDEMENYKYSLLKTVNFNETIPFHISMYVEGIPMYASPFDKHIYMMIGRKKYTPVDYDKLFNFKILGAREGMVFFPRYDPETGKDVLEKARDIRVILDGSIGYATASRGDITWVWDITKDRGHIATGTAATRLEIDRLLKRMEKLNADRKKIQSELEAVNEEYDKVNSRINELQSSN